MYSTTSKLATQLAERGGWADSVALVDERTGATRTHAQVHDDSRRLAEEYREHGIGAGDHVGLAVGDRLEWMPAFLALHALGAIPLVVNPDLDESVRTRMLAILPTAFVIKHHDATPRVRRFRSETVLDSGYHRESSGARYYLYSSGTTGNPKAVAHSSADLAVFHRAVGGPDGLDIRATDTIVSLSQYYFTYGFNNQFVYSLFSGASVVLSARRRDEAAFARCLHRHGATLAFSVPSALARLADHIAKSGLEPPPTLRAIVCAGEPLSDEVAERVEDLWQIPVANQIGSTEVGNAFCANGTERVARGTAGLVCPGYTVELRADEQVPALADAPDRAVGAVWVSGPTVAPVAVTARGPQRLLVDGWLETKDYGYWADNGGLVVIGRTDDFLHVGGISISAVEIETALRAHPDVADCAVLVAELDGAAALTALVVTEGSVTDADDLFTALRAGLRAGMEPFRVPKRWTAVAAIPRTASGKIMRHRLGSVVVERLSEEVRR